MLTAAQVERVELERECIEQVLKGLVAALMRLVATVLRVHLVVAVVGGRARMGLETLGAVEALVVVVLRLQMERISRVVLVRAAMS